MVYRKTIMLTGKPVHQMAGPECLLLMVGDHDRVGQLLVYQLTCCPAGYLLELADLVSDVMLQFPRLVVLGDFNINARAIVDRQAQDFLAIMRNLSLSHVLPVPMNWGWDKHLNWSSVLDRVT